MTRLGNLLFRHRAIIGIAGFILTFAFAHPSARSLLVGLIPIVLGLVVRTWAASYIGTAGRVRDIGVQTLITTGPYRYVKHPLYVGNFLLVLGVLIALHPMRWLTIIILALFVIEYTIIARAESLTIAATATSNLQSSISNLQSSIPGPRSSTAESKIQNQKSKIPSGPSPLRFAWPRARNEWITVALLVLVYLLALLRLRFLH